MAEFALFPTPIGDCGIAWSGELVVATNLPEETPDATASRLARRASAEQGAPPQSIQEAIKAVTALLEGDPIDLDFILCDLSGTEPFEQKVYAVTRTIPAGKVLTYGDVAAQLGGKHLSRAVGGALGRNPIPIIVPCHRVMGANGKLTGFSANGGVDTKLKLLDIEKASIGEAGDLFGHLPLAVKPRS